MSFRGIPIHIGELRADGETWAVYASSGSFKLWRAIGLQRTSRPKRSEGRQPRRRYRTRWSVLDGRLSNNTDGRALRERRPLLAAKLERLLSEHFKGQVEQVREAQLLLEWGE